MVRPCNDDDEDDDRIDCEVAHHHAADDEKDELDYETFRIWGPFGTGIRFPRVMVSAMAPDGKWLVRAFAVAIIIFASFYGWSLIR